MAGSYPCPQSHNEAISRSTLMQTSTVQMTYQRNKKKSGTNTKRELNTMFANTCSGFHDKS